MGACAIHKGIMRLNRATNVPKNGIHNGKCQSVVKAVLFILLFALIFTSVIFSVNNFELADAAAAIDVSTISNSGTTVISSSSNNNSTWKDKFSIVSDVSNASSNFGWNSSEYGGWGFTDWGDAGDKGTLYWLEFKFSGTALAAVKDGRVSFYASAHSTFEDGNDDATSMGVSFGTVHSAPTVNFISGTSSKRTDTWSSTGKSNLGYYERERFYGWDGGTFNFSASRHDFSYGSDKGAFDASYKIPTNATSIRLVFAVIGNGNVDGGYSNITLKLFQAPADTISSTTNSFSMTSGLYGDEYKIQANSTSNWSSPTRQTWENDMRVLNRVAYGANTDVKYTGSDFQDDIVNFGKLGYASSGLFAGLGDGKSPTVNGYTDLKIVLPKGVTRIDFSADLFAGSSSDTNRTPDQAKATLQLLKGSSQIKSIVADTGRKTDDKMTPHTASKSIDWSNCEINSSASTSSTTITLRLWLWANHENDDTWYDNDDNGNAFALLGNVTIKMYGAYYVSYNNGDTSATGTMDKGTYTFGIKDATETLAQNAFTNGAETFVGWATVQQGQVVYKETYTYSGSTVTVKTHDTSNGSTTSTGNKYNNWTNELTKVPGATITLYAIWVDSDFGILKGKHRNDGTWGNTSNPFIIENKVHWNNLIDIVNKSREPVDSVDGNHYGKVINTASSYTSFSGCHFALVNNLSLGESAPVGADAVTTASTAKNFKGTLYGANGTYDSSNDITAVTKALKTIAININVGAGNAGLFNYLNGATIEYIGVSGYVYNFTGSDYAGGIVGQVEGTTFIRNCESKVNVIQATFDTANNPDPQNGVGGIVGYITGGSNVIIENCKYIGGTKYTAKNVDGATVINANLFGANGVGGIVGYLPSGSTRLHISGCSSSGTITGTHNVGGIAGRVQTTYNINGAVTLSNLYNSANITVTTGNTGGGIAGYLYYSGTSSSTNTVKVQYAYNCGTVSAKSTANNYGTNIGGIVGSATASNASNVQLLYCYNTGTVSNNDAATLGIINGTGTNTVIGCWGLYAQNRDTADFSVLPTGGKGSKAIIAMGSSSTAAYFTRPSDASNTTSYAWTDITDTTKDFNKFMLFPSLFTLNAGQYLVIRDAGNNATVTPDNTSNRLTNPAALSTGLYAQNIVLNSDLKNANGGSVNQLAIEKRNITITNSLEKSNTYGNSAPSIASWATTSANPYTTVVKVEYYDGTWKDSTVVKDVKFNSGAVDYYQVKILMYNGDHLVGVIIPNGAKYTIQQRLLTVTTAWNNGKGTNYTYIYNGAPQGLKTVNIAGFAVNENVASEFTVTPDNTAYSVNEGSVAVINHTAVITLNDTISAGSYGLSIVKNNNNYKLKVDGSDIAITQNTVSWNWTINKKSIANPSDADFDVNSYNVWFGYGYNAMAAGAYSYNDASGNKLFALDMRKLGVFYNDGDSPYALVFKDKGNIYNNISSYKLYLKLSGGYEELVRDTDYTLLITSGGALNGDRIVFDGGNSVEVIMTYNGTGNYEGTRVIRFTLMSSDFGFNGVSTGANWGSSDNPYLIENAAHLTRLSQIVNGDPAWNSINSDVPSIAAGKNEDAVATDRTYANSYFRVTANIGTGTSGGFVSVGKNADNHFSGNFTATGFVITLGVDEYADYCDYTGLFGYLIGASLTDVNVAGTIKGRDYTGGIAGYADVNTVLSGAIVNNASVNGRSFVGGICGEMDCTASGLANNGAVKGMRAVGGIAGRLRQSISTSQNRGTVGFLEDTSAFDSSMFIGDGDVVFNGIGGIVGFINDDGVELTDCKNYEAATISGGKANGIGGIVGAAIAVNGDIRIISTTAGGVRNSGNVAGNKYVGGIAGYANGVTVNETCTVDAEKVTATGDYCGGIAGKWIIYKNSQLPGQRKVESTITISGVTYVGGFAGWLDAKQAKGLKLRFFITNGTATPVTVQGTSYVGAMYGGLEGYGYKRTSSTESADDTTISIDPSNADGVSYPKIYVNMKINAGGSVVGGLFGYASGVGILFLGDWIGDEHTPFTFNGSTRNTSFFGGVVGVLGDNATLESARQLDGGTEIGGVTYSVRYSDETTHTSLSVGGSFVGSVVGYIASTAGVYISSDTFLMGNHIQLYNDSAISAYGYVGGIFGAIGKVADFSSASDIKLQNLVRYGNYGTAATGPDRTLRYAPSDDGGLGKLFNLRPITGTGMYVGGIIGYVGDGALLAFKNTPVSGNTEGFVLNDASSFLSVYNGYNLNPTSGDTNTISGAGYVGGIAGYVSALSHEMNHVVNLMGVQAVSGSLDGSGGYAGGLFGYMGGGSVINCISVSGYSSVSATTDAFKGAGYVGGIVGMLAGGSISGSVSHGFGFQNVSVTKGGVAGSINAGAIISSSWTLYFADNATYATASINTNGNFVIVDKEVISGISPRFSEYARMVGLIELTGNAAIDKNYIYERATDETINQAKSGFMSISVRVPDVNKQIALYNASGNDVSTANVFETLAGANDKVYFRFDTANTANFSICVKDIEFSDIKPYSGSDEQTKKNYVAEAYIRPAANDTYSVDVDTAVFSGGYVSSAGGKAVYPGKNPGKMVVFGTFNKTFNVGDASTPYVITTQAEWDTFASNVRTNATVNGSTIKGYYGKYVKLATSNIKVTASNLAGLLSATSGTSNNTFRGTFDGDGHTITISVSSSVPSALSGMSVFPGAAGATFKNLTISGNITATGNAFEYQSDNDSENAANIAAFVGKPLGNLTFENCTNLTTIKAQRTAGGLVGFSNNYSISFVACVNGRLGAELGNIECNDNDIADYAEYGFGTGGIIGYSNSAITIESCKNEGDIKGGYNVGGIIGKANLGTTIYNCANSAKIFADAHRVDEADYASYKDNGSYRKVYVGGIIGQVGENGWLNMYASYNSGEVLGFGPIVGGLAGSVGSLLLPSAGEKDVGKAGNKSVIAYCYNTGEVYSGGRNMGYNHRTAGSGFGEIIGVAREQLCGSIVGGIVGFMAWGDINYCYNLGKITTFRIVGAPGSWQARIGGIAGQVQPTESNYHTNFNNCFNLGNVCVITRTENIVGMEDTYAFVSTKINWGGGILGFSYNSDDKHEADRISSTNCYTIKDYLYIRYFNSDGVEQDSKYGKWTSGRMTSNEELRRYIPGTVVDSIDKLTAYMTSGVKLKIDQPIGGSSDVATQNQAATLITSSGNSVATYSGGKMTYNSAFLNGTAEGYLYIYGCLPQLAVFALDTKEGLSMLSVSYGRNEYGKFVGNQAGSKESPYVVKDGVGLLAMSALNGAKSNTGGGTGYYTFKDKYIEFADGSNNIESMKASYINMNMSTDANSLKSGTSAGSFAQSGKNYFIYQLGAASSKTTLRYGESPTSASSLRTNWYNKNYYFNGTSTVNGSAYNSYVNFYPIGGATPFEGNFSGAQGASGNTVIQNLKISQKVSANSYAGLFGAIYDATVSNVTVSGSVYAYAYSTTSTYKSFAGGIAGYAGGNSNINNCQAGFASGELKVIAYSSKNNDTTVSSKSYAGAIVGAAGPSRSGETSGNFKTLNISNSRSAYATVNAIRKNIGGIVGYVGNPWLSSGGSSGRGNYVNLSDVYVYGTTVEALSGATSSDAGTDIGGIIGSNDGDTILTVSGAYVGIKHPNDSAATLTVKIYGENSIGGIIGTANGNTAIGNVNVTNNVLIERKGYDNVENVTSGLYYTAIGGVAGRTVSDKTDILRDSIKFDGTIKADVANTSASENNPVANIGGIIGAMGSGTRFLSGSVVEVTGKINSSLTSFIRNIGGVAGATIDGAFDGTFNVSPTVKAASASNIGGFIGRNLGVANILASEAGTTITIGADISGVSQVGGLVGMNGYAYADGTTAGTLQIGADTYLGARYEGNVTIIISATAKITGSGDDVAGLVGSNIVSGNRGGLVITKGVLNNYGTVNGRDNVGGIIGNNEGDITMGGSSVASAVLVVENLGQVSGNNHVGGVIGHLRRGSIAGSFGNTGSVSGEVFVGGSIGRLDNDAVLQSDGAASTYFYNGNDYDANETEEAFVAAGENALNGTVTGKKYVGGSIGGMFGTILGTASYSVSFINAGEVRGESFMGGNIGLLAGRVDYAQFTNSGQVIASGSNAIGGSVGFIGLLRSDIASGTYPHKTISLRNTHFEFVGNNDMVVSGASVADEDFEWGGVGGAIGAIGSAANDFDNDGSKWQNVTLYTASGISAQNIYNVGGAIGLIKADNIVISNMLAFYTSITGKKYVGGIVGAVEGHNIRIEDSFNIEGTVSGDTAGGIVGYAIPNDTIANTSYWVKGYANAELMALDLSQIVDALGKYIAVSDGKNVFTKELTDAYGSPSAYTGNEADGTEPADWAKYLEKFSHGKAVTLQNDVWSYSTGNTAGYTTGEAHTGWYYAFANDQAGLDTTHINVKDNSKPSVLAADERQNELKYWKRIANAYTADERKSDESGSSEATVTLTSPIVGTVNGTTVTGNGEINSGFIYAAACNINVSGYYLYMDASGVKPAIYYGEATDWNGTGTNVRPFYLIAKTSLENDGDTNSQNIAVYYRSVGIGGTLTYNGYKRYVPITDEIGSGTNQTIEYLSSEEMLEEGRNGEYAYTMDKVVKDGAQIGLDEVIEVGTYLAKVTIYYCDSLGKWGVIGGIGTDNGTDYSDYGELRITEKSLTTKLGVNTSGIIYDGDNTGGSIDLTVDGIAPLDNGINTLNGAVRTIKFNISGDKSDIITGTLDIGKLMSALGASGLGSKSFGTTAEERALAKELMAFASDRIYLSAYTVSRSTDSEVVNNWTNCCNCIIDNTYTEGIMPLNITVKFRFVETIDDNFNVSLDATGMGKNYKADDIKEPFKIEPRRLALKLSAGARSVGSFGNVNRTTQYYFDGWAATESSNKVALIQELDPYFVFYKGVTSSDDVVASGQWTSMSTGNAFTISANSINYASVTWINSITGISLADMLRVGKYTLSFNKAKESDGKLLTVNGNYYIELEEDPLYTITENELTMTWSADNTCTYDAQYHWLSASFVPRDEFGSADALADELKTIFPESDDLTVDAVSDVLARVNFRVGPNAGTHTKALPGGDNAHTENCNIQNPTSGSYVINKLDISVELAGSNEYVYNGGYHQATGITAACADNASANPNVVSYNATTGEYVLQMFGDNIVNETGDNQVKFTLTYNGGTAAVNVGAYTAEILSENVRPVTANANFNVTASGTGSLTITPAEITLSWISTMTFTYDAKEHGRGLDGSLTTAGDGLSRTSFNYKPTQSNRNATMTLINAFGKNEVFTIPVGGTHIAVNANNYIASVNLDAITISGTNAAGSATKNNYVINFTNAENGRYTIEKRRLTVSGINGAVTTKVYDATTRVFTSGGVIGTAVFTDKTVVPSNSAVTVTAVYDSPNVGNDRTITYTVTVNDSNFTFGTSNTTTYTRSNCSITRRVLTVRMDILRNGTAIKSYDGTTWYGGTAGASSVAGETSAVSAIHRSGEGFTVLNIATAETADGAVVIKAAYKEATSGREIFDAYVNNVVGSGSDLAIGSANYGEDGYYYKNLVFTLEGDSAANYSFVVNISGITDNLGDRTGTSNNALTLDKSSDIRIEIMPYIVRANYSNTAQSYATADNTYNTDWKNVEGVANGVGGQKLPIAVVNNWKYQNNNPVTAIPAEYTKHTVIRGAVNSKVLSAKLANTSYGAQVNYRLSNQPVLTIGYFVDKDEFEIGSVASLLIATYYFAASRGEYDNEFGEVLSQAVWVLIATNEQYESGEGYPSSVVDADGNSVEISGWNAYFAWLATEAGGNKDIFLNENEGKNSGWGYYKVDESSTPHSYDTFKQVANISGVITRQDIAMLDGMFNKVIIDADGNVVDENSYTWGIGGDFLGNVIKSGEGNVLTVMGSVFKGIFDGRYDGNGYIIDGVNIIGIANSERNYFGMFERIDGRDGGVQGEVNNVHLRNFNVSVSGGGETYVGVIAGESKQTSVENVSVHATVNVNVNGAVYAGGLFGTSYSQISGAIVLGSMNITATSATAGGAVGENKNSAATVGNIVSLMQIWVKTIAVAAVNGIIGVIGGISPSGTYAFMQNAVYANGTPVSGGVTYSDLFGGSVSGYRGSDKYYYTGDTASAKGTYDVLNDVKLTKMDGEAASKTHPRESMRLADIIDIYVLMYAKTAQTVTVEGVSVDVFGITAESWLTGTAHGTDSAPIVIANQQGVALLREFRFATFTLKNDVQMYSTYVLQTAEGAFYGKVISGGYAIYVHTWDGTQTMFEAETGTATPTAALKNGN